VQSGGIGPVFGQGGGVGELSLFVVIWLSSVKRPPLFKKLLGTLFSMATVSESVSAGGMEPPVMALTCLQLHVLPPSFVLHSQVVNFLPSCTTQVVFVGLVNRI